MTDFKIYNQFISYVMSNYSYNCILKELKLITSISMILISPYIYMKRFEVFSNKWNKMSRLPFLLL